MKMPGQGVTATRLSYNQNLLPYSYTSRIRQGESFRFSLEFAFFIRLSPRKIVNDEEITKIYIIYLLLIYKVFFYYIAKWTPFWRGRGAVFTCKEPEKLLKRAYKSADYVKNKPDSAGKGRAGGGQIRSRARAKQAVPPEHIPPYLSLLAFSILSGITGGSISVTGRTELRAFSSQTSAEAV